MIGITRDRFKQGETDCIASVTELIGELSERDICLAKYAYAYGAATANAMQDAIHRVFKPEVLGHV